MAKAPRRLKVYRTDAGFYETVVAAPNQSEALKAWGVRQNLFAEGVAGVVTDQKTVEAALATPGRPLRRPLGSKAAFKVDPETPDAPKPAKAKAHPKPDRRALDKAEADLAALDDRHAEQLAELNRRQAALEAERRAVDNDWQAARRTTSKALEKARRAFEKAGE